MEYTGNANETGDHILQLLSRATDILTLPAVIHRVLEITSDRNSSAADLTNIIEGDPALTVKILSVANSAYYGFMRKVSTVSHAVVVLGFHEIQNIVLSMSVIKLFDRRGSVFREKLWRHSFSVGVATRMIANYLKLKMDGKYFVGGLLHDIGKIFLDQYVPDVYNKLLTEMDLEDNIYTYHKLEESFCGMTHAEIGGKLLSSWTFPSDIIEAVAFHHSPGLSKEDPAFVACVHLADIICTIKGISPIKDNSFLPIDKDILQVVYTLKENFDTEDILRLLSQLDLEIERQSSFVATFKT
ncbi:MAG: HDOD domain-containing protein [Thermodesulfobacteriota bacterium]|nr:HDOD domain-containing protein [Thermodesulfobacteriota bacterium]